MLKEIYELRTKGSPLERFLVHCLLLLAAFYILHFACLSFLNSPWDFDHLAGYYEIAWRFWTTQSFPAGFNPYLQGGRTLGGDPQIFIFSPWTLVAGLASPLVAVKLQLLAEVFVGAWGLWRLLTFLGVTEFQRLWGLFLFLSGGGVVSRMTTGHATLGYIFFYPLLLWLSLTFEERGYWKTKRFAIALLLFAYLGNHKPNFFIYGLPPLFTESFVRSILRKNFRPFLALVLGSAAALLVNAASLLPSYFYFQEFPRHDGDEWVAIPLYTFFSNLLMPLRTLPGSFYGPRFLQRHEYNLFLGPVALYYAAKGWRSVRSMHREFFSSLLLASVLFIWVGLGSSEASAYTPYNLFYKLWPGFHSVRVPPRFWIFAAFVLIFFSTFGISEPRSKSGKTLLLSLGIFPLLVSGAINLSKPTLERVGPPFLPVRAYPEAIVWSKNDVRFQLVDLRQGRGVLQSIENLTFPRHSDLDEKAMFTYKASPPAPAEFRMLNWSKIEFEITAPAPSRLVLNMNGHPFWSISGQGHLMDPRANGPLTIEVESGISRGTLEFNQPMAYEGLIVTVLSLALVLLYIAWILLAGKKTSSASRRIIGLTGGIGSGKSTVASLFRDEGIPVIDMDQIGRDIIESDTTAQEQIVALCGDSVKSGQTIDRKKVREVVFADPQKRKALEQILHPLIWKEFNAQANALFDQGKTLVLCEAALLIENGGFKKLDGLIVVMADENTRKKRLLDRDKISNELAEKMLKTQVSDEERRKYATYLIENQSSVSGLKEQVKTLVRKLKV